jgi:cyanophycinase-like exopeptidase
MSTPECPPAPAARPAYLLADSRLLFGGVLPARLRSELEARGSEPFAAAYLGASNGDEPAFYEIFEGAMELLGVARRRFVRSRPDSDDLDFLSRADLVLLAGGEVLRGWRALEASGAAELVAARYHEGAILVGVSAGAVQLGSGWLAAGDGEERILPTAGLLPFMIDAHDEPGWAHLRRTMQHAPKHLAGLGIPFGGAAVVAPDMTVEPLEKGLLELFRQGDLVREALLVPGAPQPAAMPAPLVPAAAGGS